MKIKIINCSDSMMWYKNSIGLTLDVVSTLDVVRKEVGAYWVRDNTGFYNIVMLNDAEILEV